MSKQEPATTKSEADTAATPAAPETDERDSVPPVQDRLQPEDVRKPLTLWCALTHLSPS